MSDSKLNAEHEEPIHFAYKPGEMPNFDFSGWQKTESFGVARKNETKFRTRTFLKTEVGGGLHHIFE